jgi:alkanesulfonate monooxygenase SsuD/methylene tetrahydromethanopterin reductase-like flavin-dependent oxidoreductase (luciferase family)
MMSKPVQLYCWHFMSYPYLPKDFDARHESGWVTVPNRLWDIERSRGLYQEYIDQLVYGSELGFDGMVLNEHHQNIYGLMPSPNLIAAALTQRTSRGKIVILGNLLPLHMNPLRVAEEYAMLDNMSDGRLVAGFAPGAGPETFNYDLPSAASREQFWEAVELIHRAWTEEGPFAFEGNYYPLRYVNPWPRPTQVPHPPIWIPGARSSDTLVQIAKRGYSYFLSSRSHGAETARAQAQFAKVLEQHGSQYHPFRMGILMSAYVAETDAQAQDEAKEGIWYFLKNCLKGHLRREGRQLTFGPGIPYIPAEEFRRYLEHSDPTTKLLGDAEDWDDLIESQSIVIGSPDTVYQRIAAILEAAPVGNLLIQFHLGNMDDSLARKSMRLFIEEVAPRLRAHSSALFDQRFPRTDELLAAEATR